MEDQDLMKKREGQTQEERLAKLQRFTSSLRPAADKDIADATGTTENDVRLERIRQRTAKIKAEGKTVRIVSDGDGKKKAVVLPATKKKVSMRRGRKKRPVTRDERKERAKKTLDASMKETRDGITDEQRKQLRKIL
ncbi:MAG: hypothetical protein DRP42_04795 [Tenericutes bacterium]|nr:MAG: hypothetical protein DRP42_04795 [Mycoplasmatota bacterium]